MSGGRLPKRIMFGNLEGAVRRGRGGKEKEWIDCVQSDIRAFGITGDWKTMALKAEVWVEAGTEGGLLIVLVARVDLFEQSSSPPERNIKWPKTGGS